MLGLRKRYRAVTADDYTQLILKDWPETPLVEVLPLIFDITTEQAQAAPTKVLEGRSDQRQTNCEVTIKELQQGDIDKLVAELPKTVQMKPYLKHNFKLELGETGFGCACHQRKLT